MTLPEWVDPDSPDDPRAAAGERPRDEAAPSAAVPDGPLLGEKPVLEWTAEDWARWIDNTPSPAPAAPPIAVDAPPEGEAAVADLVVEEPVAPEEPVVAEPVVAEPVVAEPVVAEPVDWRSPSPESGPGDPLEDEAKIPVDQRTPLEPWAQADEPSWPESSQDVLVEDVAAGAEDEPYPFAPGPPEAVVAAFEEPHPEEDAWFSAGSWDDEAPVQSVSPPGPPPPPAAARTDAAPPTSQVPVLQPARSTPTASPRTRSQAIVLERSHRVRSALGLLAVSVIVGLLVAGLIAVTVVAISVGVRRAVG